MNLRALLCLSFVILAASCGGGGGGGEATAQTSTKPDSGARASADYVQMDAAGEPYLLRCEPGATKIVLFLHTWSGDLTQVRSLYPDGMPGACVVSPNFYGPNTTAQAIASDQALARIALSIVDAKLHTGLTRVDMIAASGGTLAGLGYLARYGGIQRASLWLPIYDLESLYWTTTDAQVKGDLQAVLGVPSLNDPVYLSRSPKGRLASVVATPCSTAIALNAGTLDTVTPIAQAEAARDRLQQVGVSLTYTAWPITHVFDITQREEAVRQITD